jgi:hypothetical protein
MTSLSVLLDSRTLDPASDDSSDRQSNRDGLAHHRPLNRALTLSVIAITSDNR